MQNEPDTLHPFASPLELHGIEDPHTENDEWDKHGPNEECGVFGIFAPREEVARITFFGLFALQHRGQESAGIAVSDGQRLHVHKDMGLVTKVFDEEKILALKGISAIGHTRYSTTGSSVLCNAQPICRTTSVGDIAVAHNGNLINTEELRAELEADGCEFESSNDSEVIAQLLAKLHRGHIEETVAATMKRLKGAYSLVILTPDKVIGVRDPYGIRPLCIGRINGSKYVLASESCALIPVGAQFVRDVEPGEVIIIDRDGQREFQAVPAVRNATCLFEFIYFARPDSILYGKSLHQARRRMGQELAREHPCEGAHVVIPVPDTSIPAAIGYAEASRIPYGEGVIKNRYIQRTFIQPNQRMRDLGAKMKYSPLKETLAGNRVVMVDDSIVRGTTTGKLVKMLFEAGAREVHVRITAPPVKNPCYYGIDMANQDELVAARVSVEEIRKLIGATSLGYLSLDGVVKAIGISKDKFCRACFDGKYPIPIPPRLKVSKLMLEPRNRVEESVVKSLEQAETPARAGPRLYRIEHMASPVPKPLHIGLLAVGTVAAVVASRLIRKRTSTSTDVLASALVDCELLERQPDANSPSGTADMTVCAGYLLHLLKTTRGESHLSPRELAGSSVKCVHPYSGARASVLCERTASGEALVFSMVSEGHCTVRGKRSIGSVRIGAIPPSRELHDVVQIELTRGSLRGVQVESCLKVSELSYGSTNGIHGNMTLVHSSGHTAQLSILIGGQVNGSVSSGGAVLGRWVGTIDGGIEYLAFQHNADAKTEGEL